MGHHAIITFQKENGSLKPYSEKDKILYDLLVSRAAEGTKVEVYYEIVDDGKVSYPKISKLHKCIRDIATETGELFEKTKIDVKKAAGLCNGDECKSFANCSNGEIDLAIQACVEIGDFIGMNLR